MKAPSGNRQGSLSMQEWSREQAGNETSRRVDGDRQWIVEPTEQEKTETLTQRSCVARQATPRMASGTALSRKETGAGKRHTAAGRREPGNSQAKLVIRNRRLLRLPGQRRGEVVRGKPSRNQEIRPKRIAGESGITRRQSGEE